MTTVAPQPAAPLRTFPAHYGVAVLAAFGTVALQFAWPKILDRPPAASWWPLDACVLVAATGYLAATVWMHGSAARWSPAERSSRIWRLGRALVADVVVGLLALAVFLRGPESAVFRAGLGLLLPTLLTVAAASALVSILALVSALRRPAAKAPPEGTPASPPRLDLLRLAFTIAVLAALIALERFEPQVNPWQTAPSHTAPSAVH